MEHYRMEGKGHAMDSSALLLSDSVVLVAAALCVVWHWMMI
jgi:hypothetical protein